MTTRRYLTTQSIADRFGRSKRTMFRWSEGQDGFPSPVKFRGRNYWPVDELERWEQESLLSFKREWAKSRKRVAQGGKI